MDTTYTYAFTSTEALERQLGESGMPFELAIYDFNAESRKVASLVGRHPGAINSFHAPRQPLQERFDDIHVRAAGIARAAGLDRMIVHPHVVREPTEAARLEEQARTVEYVHTFRERTGVEMIVETFAGLRRVIRGDEYDALGIRADLDIGHLDLLTVVTDIITHPTRFASVHISGNVGDQHHHRMDAVGECVIEHLLQARWHGMLGFEYAHALSEEARADAHFAQALVRGIAALTADRLGDARVLLDDAKRLRPNSYLALYGLGLTALKGQEVAEAVQHFRAALDVNPNHGDSKTMLALVADAARAVWSGGNAIS